MIEAYNKLKKRTDDAPKTEIVLVSEEKMKRIYEAQARIEQNLLTSS